MMAVVKLVSEIFMLVLCIFMGPAEQKQVRIDLIAENGYMDTLIVRRVEGEIHVLDEVDGKRKRVGTIRLDAEQPYVYHCEMRGKEQEKVDLGDAIPDIKELEPVKIKQKILKLKDGARIQMSRSGKVLYLTVKGEDRTYAIH